MCIIEVMSKKKPKKRNKPYTGEDAAPAAPVVHRYTAEVRSPLNEWWHEHKRQSKTAAYVGGGGIVFVWTVYELLRLIFHW
jgi:hypothetical protein